MKTPGAVLLLLWLGLLVGAAEGVHAELTCLPDIELSGLKAQLQALETRLRASEMTVEQQRVELMYTKTQLEAMKTRLGTSESKVLAMETRLTAPEMMAKGGKNVAFSVSLERDAQYEHTGPFSYGRTLVYKQIFTNIGDAFNSNTGVFTAPVRGVYDFSISILGYGGSTPVGALLRRNGQNLIMAFATLDRGHISSSNGVSALLEKGDVVDAYLPANQRILDNLNHHSTFRGHLLFQM